MKKILLLIAIPLVGLSIGLFGIEMIIRLLPHPRPWSDRPPFYFQAEASETLQDYEHGPKEVGSFRIAVIGDSYTFAPYMQFTDAFPKILERMLNLNAQAPKVEVVNYGVPGYSTSHEIVKVEEALKEGADLILLQVTLNDPEIKPYRPIGITVFDTFGNLKVTGWKKWLLEHWKSLGFVITRIHNQQTKQDYEKYFNDLFDNPRTYRSYEDSTKKIAQLASERNVKLVSTVFPLFGLPLDENYPFHRCHEKVRELMTSLHVPLLDLYTLYEGLPLDRLQVIPGEDRHPNEIAHRMAAESIYSWLAKENFIPEAVKIRKRFQGRTQIIKEKPYEGE